MTLICKKKKTGSTLNAAMQQNAKTSRCVSRGSGTVITGKNGFEDIPYNREPNYTCYVILIWNYFLTCNKTELESAI